MPNTIPAPITLPDPNAVGAGQELTASAHEHLLGTLNHAAAEGHAQNVINQEWQDTLCSWNGAITQATEWRIPVLSNYHTTLDVWVEASATVNAGQVDFNSVLGAANVNAVVPVGAAAWVNVGNLTIGVGAAYEDITMSLTAGAGGTITIDRLFLRYNVLGSPLATAVITAPGATVDFTPYGTQYYANDEPMPSYTGRTLVHGCTNLLARVRCYKAWSGIDPAIAAYSANARATMTANSRVTALPVQQGHNDRGVTYRLWAKIQSDAAIDLYLKLGVQTQAGGVFRPGNTKINALAATQWYSLDFTLPEDSLISRMPWMMCRVAPFVIDDSGLEYRGGYEARYQTNIESYSIFGV